MLLYESSFTVPDFQIVVFTTSVSFNVKRRYVEKNLTSVLDGDAPLTVPAVRIVVGEVRTLYHSCLVLHILSADYEEAKQQNVLQME